MATQYIPPLFQFTHGPQETVLSRPSQSMTTYSNIPKKVTKIKNCHLSPKHGSRRRVGTNIPVRARSVTETLRTHNLERAPNHQARPLRSRPVSWQPQIYHDHILDMSNLTYSGDVQHYNQMVMPIYNSLTQPMSMTTWPVNEVTTNLADYSCTTDAISTSYYTGYTSTPYSSFVSGQTTPLSVNNEFCVSKNPSYAESIFSTVPTPPEHLNMLDLPPQPTQMSRNQVPKNDELVALGLYDSPAQVQFSRLTISDGDKCQQRTMKLEDAFVPDEADDANDDLDAESDFTEASSAMQINPWAASTSLLTQPILSTLQYPYAQPVVYAMSASQMNWM